MATENRLRACLGCGRDFKAHTNRYCSRCRATDRVCTKCGRDFRGHGGNICSTCNVWDCKCIECGAKFRGRMKRCQRCSRPEGACIDCGVAITLVSTRCRKCNGAKRGREAVGRTWYKNGYILQRVPHKKGGVPQHRLVMEEHIGRPLTPEETVHHVNGVKDDNRIENLELWSHSHPSGQRVTDKISWAKQFLMRYNTTSDLVAWVAGLEEKEK